MPTSTTLEPTDALATAATLADASRQHQKLIPKGSGTKLEWAGTTPDDALLSTRQLREPIEHFAGDLVATIPGGATLAEANAVLARSGQWLPLDPSFAGSATIGGIVATNDSGPRRHKYGAPRDLIIGVELALCDGRIARAGGRVVKNVAGYDLSRLVCGSFGSLAVITRATFKLAPLPSTSRTVVAACRNSSQAARLALQIAAEPVTPSAIDIEAPSARLLIRFETTERAADQMAASIRSLLDKNGISGEVAVGDSEASLWRQHDSVIWHRPGLVAKISILPSLVGALLESLDTIAPGGDAAVIGRAALGVLLIRIDGAGHEAAYAGPLRQWLDAHNGTMTMLRGPRGFSSSASSGSLREVMNAIKLQFDPESVLPALP